jgi:hypothetical protein
VLRGLPKQLRDLLEVGDPSLERLFPPAYLQDPDLDAEYQELMRGDLIAGRLSTVEVMERTIEARRLSEDEVVAWLGAINDLRLVLGTRLEVTEEATGEDLPDDDPRASAFAVYFYLGWLEEQVVEALAESLDPDGTEGR